MSGSTSLFGIKGKRRKSYFWKKTIGRLCMMNDRLEYQTFLFSNPDLLDPLCRGKNCVLNIEKVPIQCFLFSFIVNL